MRFLLHATATATTPWTRPLALAKTVIKTVGPAATTAVATTMASPTFQNTTTTTSTSPSGGDSPGQARFSDDARHTRATPDDRIRHVGHSPTSIVVQKRWGQQCGVSCGCVLRLELELDDCDKVVSAVATTKRILARSVAVDAVDTTPASSSSTQSTKSVLKPLLTNRQGRLQCTSPSNCATLQTLSNAVVQYMPGRYLWQLQNYISISGRTSGLRSSLAFCQSVLHPLLVHDTTSSTTVSSNNKKPPFRQSKSRLVPVDASSSSTSTTSWLSYTPCFDVVEDALTALLKGYIPAARPPISINWVDGSISDNGNNSYNSSNGWIEHQSALVAHTDRQLVGETETAFISSWIESCRYMLSALWRGPPLEAMVPATTSPSRLSLENSLTTSIRSTTPFVSSKYNGAHNHSHYRYYYSQSHDQTALDWMDWAEQERQLHDLKQQRERQMIRPKYSDWLSYVDAFYREQQLQKTTTLLQQQRSA